MKSNERGVRIVDESDPLDLVMDMIQVERAHKKDHPSSCAVHDEDCFINKCHKCQGEREVAMGELARRATLQAQCKDDVRTLYLFKLLEAILGKPAGGGGGGLSARDVYDAVHNPNKFHGGAGW